MKWVDILKQEYRTRRMARFSAWVLAYGLALWLVDRFTGGVSSVLQVIFWLGFIAVAAYYLYRLGKTIKHRVLWPVRGRLIVTYFFIAVAPVLLILVLVGLGVYLVSGQVASFLIASRLRSRAAELRQLTRVVVHHAQDLTPSRPEVLLDGLQTFVRNDLAEHSPSDPGLEVTLGVGPVNKAFRLDGAPLPNPTAVPPWLKENEYAGIVVDHGQMALRALDRARVRDQEVTVIISEPFTTRLLDEVGTGIGPVGLFGPAREVPGATGPRLEAPSAQEAVLRSQSVAVPSPASFFDFTVYNPASLEPLVWSADHEQVGEGYFWVSSRIVALNKQVSLGQLSGIYWVVFAVIGVVFLLLELVALVIGSRLTRSITTTVDQLHLATERVKAGDFSHRIALPARDQLSSLGEAFDNMTASVERLLSESLEKTRLEGELEIAREVQNRLFPQTIPEVSGLYLYGACKPARVVSGDYYDFFRIGDHRVAVVLGDISGKGISAALLMASIQSALHAQFYDGSPPGKAPDSVSTADVVSRLNRQLFENTPREKYVTFFYAVYDARTRKLTYTNAGHLPPVLFRGARVERLAAGGTVAGLFPTVNYEQAEIELQSGDLLLAFTDGMTEPENSFGEEFGEQRLLDAARRGLGLPPEAMVDEIYRSVDDWTGSPELQDDMTLVLAKATA
jgi:phosphoserine phosphatase RsbU/P